MFLVEKYEDGSQLLGYEPGDRVRLTRDVECSWGMHFAKKGTEVTVVGRTSLISLVSDKDKHNRSWSTAIYRIDVPGYGETSTMECFEPLPSAEIKPESPEVYVVEFEDSAYLSKKTGRKAAPYWKHFLVLAFSETDAMDKARQQILSWGEGRLALTNFRHPFLRDPSTSLNSSWISSISF